MCVCVCVCVCVQKKYVSLGFIKAYRAAELRVSKHKDNIKMDIKEITLMTTRIENNLINI